MLLTLLAYWVIGFPLAYGLGVALGRGPVWVGLIAGLTVCALLFNPALRPGLGPRVRVAATSAARMPAGLHEPIMKRPTAPRGHIREHIAFCGFRSLAGDGALAAASAPKRCASSNELVEAYFDASARAQPDVRHPDRRLPLTTIAFRTTSAPHGARHRSRRSGEYVAALAKIDTEMLSPQSRGSPTRSSSARRQRQSRASKFPSELLPINQFNSLPPTSPCWARAPARSPSRREDYERFLKRIATTSSGRPGDRQHARRRAAGRRAIRARDGEGAAAARRR